MMAFSLPDFYQAYQQTLLVGAMGLAVASVTLALGFVLATRRRRKAPPAVKGETRAPDPFIFGSATEKRAALRRRGYPIKVLLADAEGKGRQREVWIVDRSVGGLCLQTDDESIAIGTIVSVRTTNAPQGTPWTQVEVRSCRQEGDSWEHGCQFIRTPSWNVLLLFG